MTSLDEPACTRTYSAPSVPPSYTSRAHCVSYRWENSPSMYHDGSRRSIDYARCCAVKRLRGRDKCKRQNLCVSPIAMTFTEQES